VAFSIPRLVARVVRRFLLRQGKASWTHPQRGSRTFLSKGKHGMKTKPAKRPKKAPEDAIQIDTTQTIFSSDLLTPEEERSLLATFWECKSELVRNLVRYFPKLRSQKPIHEPWPMAQFIRDYCDSEARNHKGIRHVHDRYIHCKHRLASATTR
jgi:RNA polymerase primary sigma factor